MLERIWSEHLFLYGEREKDEEENERGRDSERQLRAANPKSLFFEILSDLNQAVPNHLADESQTR